MQGNKEKILDILKDSSKRFIIPVYQRNYEWKKDNCKQLLSDLIRIKNNNLYSHFFGSIVTEFNPSGNKIELYIIDGQQRLTTISILLLAIYALLEDLKVVSKNINLKDMILEEYLIDKWSQEEKIKLKPVKDDYNAFVALFTRKELIQDSNITINFNFFYNYILDNNISVEDLFDSIQKLDVIWIKLEKEDNAQLIFESLNSTGLELSEGDKIRNFILMDLEPKKQEIYYNKYWNKIEKNTKHHVSEFIKDYLTIKLNFIPSNSKLYFIFKEYVYANNIQIDILLDELYNYSMLYNELLEANTSLKNLNPIIRRLNQLEITVIYPFLLEILNLKHQDKLDNDSIISIFSVTESYLFRRLICDLPTNALNKFYASIHKEIIKYNDSLDEYLDKYVYILFSKKDRLAFPNDNEFKNELSNKNIYALTKKNKVYIFERLENGDSKEDKDIYRHCENGDYTIEHIMPRKLSKIWKQDLGTNYEKIHNKWLDRLANLTLTAYNSKYSNRSFDEKKNMEDGYIHSGIKLNQYIAQFDCWTLKEIEERNKYLSSKALDLWPRPKTSFVPVNNKKNIISLSDDEELFTGQIILSFSFKDMEQQVTSWTDMYETILNILFNIDEKKFYDIVNSAEDEYGLKPYISNNKNSLREYIEITNGLFIEKNTSTHRKIIILKKLFDVYDIQYTDLDFCIR